MRQSAWILALGMLAPVLAGCGGSGPAGGSAGPGTGSGPGAPPACRTGALALGYGPELSPMTEEHGDWYTLTNRGASACTLAGYPAVTLYGADGTRLRFRYIHRHSQFITPARPHAVLVRPGASAWILIAKNACIMKSGKTEGVTRIRITPPGAGPGSVSGRSAGGQDGVSNLDHCGNKHDPGRYVAVSPVEPTRLATLPVQAQ